MEKRVTKVEVFYSTHGFYHLVVQPFCTTNTYIITVDTTTGSPQFIGVPMIDIFPDHSLAVSYITSTFESSLKMKGDALLGILKTDDVISIGIVESVEISGWLPGGHLVQAIRNVKLIKVILNDKDNSTPIDNFQLSDNHYYCETYDITRLMPSNKPSYEPDPGFCWNNAWRRPFEEMGIGFCCIALIQGICQSYTPPGKDFSITHICRRSSANPGTRYSSRGLNNEGKPGNEVEGELIFVRGDVYYSHRWRRGSVPIHWNTILDSKVSTPKHKVDTEHYYEGTPQYFTYLKDRYHIDRILCISLLQTKQGDSESELVEYYSRALSRLPDENIYGVSYMPFDINRTLHEGGSEAAFNEFLKYIKPLIDDAGFEQGATNLKEPPTNHQVNLMRYNCADSLDRTNLATFYSALYVTLLWLKQQNLLLTTEDIENKAPNQLIPQDVIDFLAKTFVESGNIVSTLSTNTQAIKVNAIKHFSPNLPYSSNDSAITLQRRLQNVLIDPQRQKAIEAFTDMTDKFNSVLISPSYVNTLQNTPHTLVSLGSSMSLLDKNVSYFITLPRPVIVKQIKVLLSSLNKGPTYMRVEGGLDIADMKFIGKVELPDVEMPVQVTYPMLDIFEYGHENKTPFYATILKFSFTGEEQQFVVGPIRVIGQFPPYNNRGIQASKEAKEADQSTVDRFKISFEQYMSSPKTLFDAITLERARVGLLVPERTRFKMCTDSGISPWKADSASQIIACDKTKCAFCGKLFQDGVNQFICRQSKIHRGLLASDSYDESLLPIYVCEDCSESASICASTTSILEEEGRMVIPNPREAKRTEMMNHELEVIDRCRDISTSYQTVLISASSDQARDIFYGADKTEVMESFQFEVAFHNTAVISFLCFRADSEDVQVVINDEEAKKMQLRDGRLQFVVNEPLMTELVKFKVVIHEKTVISDFKVYGTILVVPKDAIHPELPFKGKSELKIISVPPAVNQAERILTYRFSGRTKINKIIFNTIPKKHACRSLIISMSLKKQGTWNGQLIIPKTSIQTNFIYNLEKSVDADMISFSFIDRIHSFTYPTITFA